MRYCLASSGCSFADTASRSRCVLRVIASEAKQSMEPRKERMDCFVASLLAMTTNIGARPRRASRARFAKYVPPSEIQRAQGMPGGRCARSLVCKKTNTRVSHHGHTGNHPAFPAQWFYGLLRALPGDQACLTPSPALLLADLTPALGRQNDTTSPYASRPRSSSALPRPPHPAPRP